MENLVSLVRSFQFNARKQVLGRLRLRRGLPSVRRDSHGSDDESRIYSRIFRAFFEAPQDRFKTVWDIGCRNWSYAPSLAEFFPEARLIGIEVDGFRRFWNFYRRMDFALAQAEVLASRGRQASCFFSDFRDVPVSEGNFPGDRLFCFLFPFVSETPCLKWGLPLKYSRFSDLMRHALSLSPRSPFILSCHQGDWEAERAQKAYQDLGLDPREKRIETTDLPSSWPRNIPIHVFLSDAIRRS